MPMTVSLEEIYQIIYQESRDPFQILGPHLVSWEGKQQIAIRAFLPRAMKAYIVAMDTQKEYEMTLLRKPGFYVSVIARPNSA
jgi:hypothetical protein